MVHSHEMRLVQGLIFLAQAPLGSCVIPEVAAVDSSTYGFALLTTSASAKEVRAETKHRDK